VRTVTSQEQQLLTTFVAALYVVMPEVTPEQASLITEVVEGMLREHADDMARGRSV